MHSICIFSNVLQHLLMKYATDTHMKGANVRAYLCTLQREWMMLCSGHTVTRQQRSMLHTWGISHSDNSGTVWEGNVKAVTLTPMSVCHWALWHLRFWNPSYIQQTCGWAEAVRLTLSQGKCDTIMKWRCRQGVGKECYISLGFRQPLLVTKF